MFWENFKQVCDERGMKPTPVLKNCGISTGSIGRWQKGASPYADAVLAIAEYLNCSTDILLRGNEFNQSVKLDIMNQELEIIELYHLLPEQTKELVCDLIKLLYEKDSKSNKTVSK